MALQWLLWLVLPAVALVKEIQYAGVFAGLSGGVAVLLWWALFSRAPRLERWGGAALMILAVAATPHILPESIATGMMGLMFFVYAVPLLSLAFVLWAVFARRLPDGARRLTVAAAILLACGGWALLRTDGIRGGGAADYAWRWSPTAEQRLLARPAPVTRPASSPRTIWSRANRGGSARTAAGTARLTWRRSTASRRSC